MQTNTQSSSNTPQTDTPHTFSKSMVVSFLESATIVNKSPITDMSSITREVSKFASDKKLEIETLKIREEYRREFLGNISHELKTPLFTVQGYISTLLDGGMKDKTIRKKYLARALVALANNLAKSTA